MRAIVRISMGLNAKQTLEPSIYALPIWLAGDVNVHTYFWNYSNVRENESKPAKFKAVDYRPLARRWECSQSGGHNNKISIPRKISFGLPPRLAAFPQCARGLLTFSGKGVGMEFGERTRMIAHTNHRTQTTWLVTGRHVFKVLHRTMRHAGNQLGFSDSWRI